MSCTNMAEAESFEAALAFIITLYEHISLPQPDRTVGRGAPPFIDGVYEWFGRVFFAYGFMLSLQDIVPDCTPKYIELVCSRFLQVPILGTFVSYAGFGSDPPTALAMLYDRIGRVALEDEAYGLEYIDHLFGELVYEALAKVPGGISIDKNCYQLKKISQWNSQEQTGGRAANKDGPSDAKTMEHVKLNDVILREIAALVPDPDRKIGDLCRSTAQFRISPVMKQFEKIGDAFGTYTIGRAIIRVSPLVPARDLIQLTQTITTNEAFALMAPSFGLTLADSLPLLTPVESAGIAAGEFQNPESGAMKAWLGLAAHMVHRAELHRDVEETLNGVIKAGLIEIGVLPTA